MTISVSANGEYAEAEGMWVSHNGEWVAVDTGGGGGGGIGIPGGGEIVGEIALQGTPTDGSILVTGGVAGMSAHLIAYAFADARAGTLQLDAKTLDPSGSATFYPADFLPSSRAVLNINGLVAAIYFVQFADNTRTEGIAIEGEAVWGGTSLTRDGWMDCVCVAFIPASSATIGDVSHGVPFMSPYYYNSVSYSFRDVLRVQYPIYDIENPPYHSGWARGTGISHYKVTLFKDTTATSVNLFTIGSDPVLGAAPPSEQLLLSGVTLNTLAPCDPAVWGSPRGVTAHQGAADSWDRTNYLYDDGITYVNFYASSCIYAPTVTAEIDFIDQVTLQVTSTPNTQVSVVVTAPYVTRDNIPSTGYATAVTDPVGSAYLTPADIKWLYVPDTQRVVFEAGTYTVTNAIGTPSVKWSGTSYSSVPGMYDYIYVYDSTAVQSNYSPSDSTSAVVGCYTSTDYYYKYLKWLHDEPVPQPGWTQAAPTLVINPTYAATLHLLTVPISGLGNGMPWPTETEVGVLTVGPNFGINNPGEIPWPASFTPNSGLALTGNNVGPNAGNSAAQGADTYGQLLHKATYTVSEA